MYPLVEFHLTGFRAYEAPKEGYGQCTLSGYSGPEDFLDDVKFKEGDRVILPANAEEGWVKERGVVLGVDMRSETIIVELDKDCWHDDDVDGLREMGFDGAELEK